MINGLEPRLTPWAEQLLGQARVPVRITSTRRSPLRQTWLHRRALSGHCEGCFGVAPAGQSIHEHGLAWDMIAPLGELRRLGRLWRSWGGVWGGGVDPIHFEASARMLRNGPSRL